MKKLILVILASLGVFFILCGAFIAYTISRVDYKFTGQQLFDAINEYRVSVNVQPLALELDLCDNLVERYLAVKEPNTGHKGYEEWLANEGLVVDGKLIPKYGLIAELYVTASTPDNAINFWVGSPGHRLTLEKPEFNVGCAYALEGTGVVIVAIDTEK